MFMAEGEVVGIVWTIEVRCRLRVGRGADDVVQHTLPPTLCMGEHK